MDPGDVPRMGGRQSKPRDEEGYLALVRRIIERASLRLNRTGVPAQAVFGKKLKFSLRDGVLPLLTTKRVNFRAVVEELLWFLRGETDAHALRDRGVRIWDANTEKTDGDIGPMYGWQWRRFGATYAGKSANYEGQGVDQLANILQLIKRNPFSRRILMTAYNPCDAPKGVLDPCHVLVQFFVEGDELSSCLYQRSADMGLGVPFNIASYALLTHLIARCTGLRAKKFVHLLGDAHVYENHVEPLKEQLQNSPRPFPHVKFADNWPETGLSLIDQFDKALTPAKIELVGYNPHPAIPMPMAV